MDNIEVKNSLKSSFDEKRSALEVVQAKGVEAIKALDEARASGDETKVSEASAYVKTIGAEIVAAKEAVEQVQEMAGWFKEYHDELEVNTKSKGKEDFTGLFEELSAKSNGTPQIKRTVGEHFASLLEHRGIKSWDDVKDRKGETQLTVALGKQGLALDEVKSLKDIKSIYINNGTEFTDAGGNPVPGFAGAQCGLVEDPGIACLLDPPEGDFEECLQTLPFAGNRIRFTREVSRNYWNGTSTGLGPDGAKSVLETIYNPYPDMEQDGTKPESTFRLETAEVKLGKIANFITASDEVLEDCGFIAQHIDHVLINNVQREKQRQLIVGSGTGGEMLGLLNQPDMLERTHQDTGDGGTADDNIYDTFRRSMTDLWFSSARVDNLCVIMNPRDGEIIDLTKDGDGRYLFNDADCFNRNLRCLTIRYSTDVPAGTAIMGNFGGNWQFYVRQALNIRIGLTGDQFITNTQTILAEMRGLTILRCPSKIIRIDGLA